MAFDPNQPRDDIGRWTDDGVRHAVGSGQDAWEVYPEAPYPNEVTDKELRGILQDLKRSGRLNDDGTVSVFHVTLSDSEKILREGLIPAKEKAPGQDWEATHSRYATYFHLDAGKAFEDTQYGGEVIEARIPVTKDFLRRIIPDEDSASVPEYGRRILRSGGGAIALIGGMPAPYLRVRKTLSSSPIEQLVEQALQILSKGFRR